MTNIDMELQNMRNGYMVLSIRELNEIIKKAREKSRNMYDGKINRQSTIILDLIFCKDEYDAGDGAKQVQIKRYR